MTRELIFSPYLPIWLVAGLVAIGIVLGLIRCRTSVWGGIARVVTALMMGAALLAPGFQETEGDPLTDIVLVLTDQSRSMEFASRSDIAAQARQRLIAEIDGRGIEVKDVPFGGASETDLETALRDGLADISASRLAGVFVITDGQIHGDPSARSLSLAVPVHALLTGDPASQIDRRIEVVSAPRFGVVGDQVTVTLKVISDMETGTLPTRLFVGGELHSSQDIPIGQDVTLSVRLSQPGKTILELEVDEAPGELTRLNNRAVVDLTAVRDRLRVLLVSGQPHAGERVWRNILKSDPSVDLVHFTILKPGDKARVARTEELNLIEFPHEELFLEKLDSFDVVIFDRYTYRYVLQAYEFEQIARYVERGGAVLIAAGPEFSDRGSLASRPNLAYILPVLPRGRPQESSYVPTRTNIGERHPITSALENSEDWGRWLRYIPGDVRDGDVLLSTPSNQPLLIVDRVQNGRIAVIMSDHVWLWARGFDGGGPHQELLRRLVHWLMKEPELEEESLSGQIAADGMLTVERRTLADSVSAVTITSPDGTTEDIVLNRTAPGTYSLRQQTEQLGLYRLQSESADGRTLYALAATGEDPGLELGAMQTTDAVIRQWTEATSGGIWTLPTVSASLPDIRQIGDSGVRATSRWAGVIRRDARSVEAVRIRPLLPPALWMILIAGLAILAWFAESGRLQRRD